LFEHVLYSDQRGIFTKLEKRCFGTFT